MSIAYKICADTSGYEFLSLNALFLNIDRLRNIKLKNLILKYELFHTTVPKIKSSPLYAFSNLEEALILFNSEPLKQFPRVLLSCHAIVEDKVRLPIKSLSQNKIINYWVNNNLQDIEFTNVSGIISCKEIRPNGIYSKKKANT